MEKTYPSSRLESVLKTVILLIGSAYTALYFFLSIPRLHFPYEIEFFEGTVLEHALRIFQGKQLFIAPGIEFVNLQYQPLYYYVVSWAMGIFGAGYLAGRFVSLVAIIVSAILILYIVRRETRSWWLALTGSSLFFACYGLTGYWYELTKVDSLMLALLIGAVAAIQIKRSLLSLILSAFLLALAFFTKQQILFYIFPILIWLFLQKKRDAFLFLFFFAAFMISGVVLFSLGNDGWYWYHTFTLPRALVGYLHWEKVPGGLTKYIFGSFGAGMLLFSYYWITYSQKIKELITSTTGLLTLLLIAAVIQLGVHLAHDGSYSNVAMPLTAFMAIIIPCFANPLLKQGQRSASYLIYCLLVVQFAGLFYSFRSVPMVVITKADHEAGAKFLEEVRAIPGNVFFPQHGFLPFQTEKQTFANIQEAEECGAANDSIARAFWAEWKASFPQHKYDAIVLDEGLFRPFDSIPGYTFVRELNLGSHPFVTRAGDTKSIPRYLFLPKK